MKKFNIVTVSLLAGSLFLGGCNTKEEASQQKSAGVVYADEYTYELYYVSMVNEEGIFGDLLNGKEGKEGFEGLYLEAGTLDVKEGDIVRAVFDGADQEFITAEISSVLAEDGTYMDYTGPRK